MKHSRWMIGAAALLAVSGCGGAEQEVASEPAAAAVTTPTETPLELALSTCDLLSKATTGDDGASLTLDGGGKDDITRVGLPHV